MAKLLGAGITANRTMTWPDADARPLTDHNTVTVPQGGTGAVTLPINGVLYGNDAGAIQALGVNSIATKKFLTQTSSGAPAWSTIAVGDGGTGLTSYAVGDLVYASGAAALSKLAAVAVGQVLVSGGVTTAPAWSASPTLTNLTLTQSGFGVVSTDGAVLQNTTPATVGTPAQWSPRLRWSGTAYNSVSGLSETISWWAEVVTAGAAGPTTGSLAFKALVNGVTTQAFFIGAAGALTLLNQLSVPIISINNNGFLIANANGQFVIENNTAAAGVGLDVTTDAVVKVRTRAHSAYATVDALGYSVSGAAGASKAAGPVTSITVVNGIVTAIS